jgi:hypothetical protein
LADGFLAPFAAAQRITALNATLDGRQFEFGQRSIHVFDPN